MKNISLDRLSGSIFNRILKARGQAANIIVDARGQAGMTKEIVKQAVVRASGADPGKGINNITFLTPNGPIVVPRRS